MMQANVYNLKAMRTKEMGARKELEAALVVACKISNDTTTC